MKVICIIPALNEKGNLEALTSRLHKEFRKLNVAYKILYILQGDDGSNILLDELKKKYSQLDYIHFAKPLGIGKAYRTGFNMIDNSATHVLTLDADLNHDPGELNKFLTVWKNYKPDIIIGSRFIKGGSFNDKRLWKRVISAMVNSFISSLLGIKIHDTTSGYRLIKKDAVLKIKNSLKENGYTFYMEFILLSQKAGSTMKEVSIIYHPRIWGKSKMGKAQTLLNYFKFMPRILLLKNPNK